jgi:PAS domain S-box-containing protein
VSEPRQQDELPQIELHGQTVELPLLTESTEADATPQPSKEPLAQSPTCDLLVWPAGLIRASALVVILFELACLGGEAAANRPALTFSLPFRATCVLFGLLLLASSFQPRLGPRWQVLAFIITAAVVTLTTMLGIVRETADQFFVDLLVLSLGASALLPWSFAWQAAENALMLLGLAAYAGLAPAHDPLLYTHWVGLVAGAAIVQLTSIYGSRYRQETKEHVDAVMRVANRLRQSEATLRRVFQVSCDSISVMHLRECRYLEVNEEFLRQGGYTIDDVIGHSALELGPAILRDPGFRSALFGRGEIRNMEFALERGDGSTGSALLSAVKVEIDNQPCVVTFARDITELKRSQSELIAAREAALAASRAKSEFLSSMSHEIRTPMNAVLGMADVLAESELTAEQRRHLNTIINNGTALLELINGILDLAKVESGRVSLERVEFSPREVVERVLETLAVRAHEKGLELVAQIAPTVPELVLGDPLRLRQILINLLGNAVKFTERGHVLIKLETQPGAPDVLRFEVHDTGVGIPTEKIDALFQPFSQADSSTSRRYGGSGLGLAIVARLVALMGGETAVESSPGAGSIFCFTARFTQPSKSVAPASQVVDLSDKRILVTDDGETNTEALRLLLCELGAAVTVVHSGSAAVELIRRMERVGTPFDAMLIDSSMPNVDGYQVVQRVARTRHRRTPFIMMIATDNLTGETNRLELLGVSNYVVKPVKRGELLASIAAAIGMRAASSAVGHSKAHKLAPRSTQRSDCRLQILFADDSPDNRALVKAYMKNTPHRIAFAENGEEAIGKFVDGQFDLVFMDIQMPIVDGYTAVLQIRRWEERSGRQPTPIIALTASADSEAVRRAHEVGCNLHVSKPLKKQALLQTIDSYAAERPGSEQCPAVA